MYHVQLMFGYILEALSYWLMAKADQCYALSVEMKAKALSSFHKSIA